MRSRRSARGVVALALLAAGCSDGYNAGVTHVGRAHLLSEWRTWGAARAVPESAAPRKLAAVRAAVRRSHSQPVSVELYRIRTGETAPVVIVASFTPRSWLLGRSRTLLDDLVQVVGRTGPYYVGLVDIHGRFVWETGRSMTATGLAGGVYAPPEIDRCQPVFHSQPVLAPAPPPCTPD
jgi:hypothetical protein